MWRKFEDYIFYRVMPVMLIGILIILLLAICIGVPWAVYDEYKSEKFYLRKDQWVCTISHTETTYVMVGKVLMPSFRQVCDEYKRVK